MTELLGKWVLGLGGGAVFCAVMTELCPKGPVKNIVKTLCGMIMALVLISPLMKLNLPSYSMNMAKYRLMGEEIAAGGIDEREAFSRTIIEEECRAYILDKGRELGAEVDDASVVLRWSEEGFWYPVECEIEGEYSPRLESAIESELGISSGGQNWRNDEDS